MKRAFLYLAIVLAIACPAAAQLNVGSDGTDGAWNPTEANTIVDLSAADPGLWTTPGQGRGVYDSVQWAVVFKYSSVNIPSGVTVTFKNNSTRAPVVWLVQGDVTINGKVVLDGENGYPLSSGLLTEPGPGGFRGGAGALPNTPASAGFGPGGGIQGWVISGSYGTEGFYGSGLGPAPTYGNPRILPLIGGSGGAGWDNNKDDNGGAGGGAILIAAGNAITLNGSVTANGGSGYWSGAGSGGSIRLIANSLTGTGLLSAIGGLYYGQGGAGRIMVESNNPVPTTIVRSPDAFYALPSNPPVIWPDGAPQVKVTRVSTLDRSINVNVPDDPKSSFSFPDQDVTLATTDTVAVRIEATNMPTDWKVIVRVVPRTGKDFTKEATLVSGDNTASVWEAQLTIPTGFSAVQARAYKP